MAKSIFYEVMVKTREGRWVCWNCVPSRCEAINAEHCARLSGYREVKTYLRRP